MIPNGQEIIFDGHKVVFESTTYQCRGCFFENRDSCPDCDGGIWVEDNPSPWHTGTPTEEGWYLCQTKGRKGSYLPSVLRWNGEIWTSKSKRPLVLMDVVAWQRIEPYTEKEDVYKG